MVYLCYFFFVSLVAFSLFRSPTSFLPGLVTALLLALFAALRGADVAGDFTVYEDWYVHRDIENGFLERPGYFEALYFLLNDIFALQEVPFRFFVGLLAFVAVFIKIHVMTSFSKNAWAVAIGVLIYACTFYLLHEFTQIRAGLAVAFIFLALHALVGEKMLLFVLWVLVAAGFHSSAVMAFLLLLPYHGARARWVDWILFASTGIVFILATRGISLGGSLVDMLTKFDPRMALYISMAESGKSESANPFAVSALSLLVLTLALSWMENSRLEMSNLAEREVNVLVLVRRSLLIGLTCLALLSPIPELALRLYEINIALVPVMAVIIFSQKNWLFQKFLLILWGAAVTFVYIAREEGLVQPYVLFFS